MADSSHVKSVKSVSSFGTTKQQIFSDIGYFRGVLVSIKHISKEHIQLTRSVLMEFNVVCEISFTICPCSDGSILFSSV